MEGKFLTSWTTIVL